MSDKVIKSRIEGAGFTAFVGLVVFSFACGYRWDANIGWMVFGGISLIDGAAAYFLLMILAILQERQPHD